MTDELKRDQIKPIHDAILVELSKSELKTTRSGIVIPSSNGKESGLTRGTIVSVGDGNMSNGTTVNMSNFKVGSEILFPDWAGTAIPANNNDSPKLIIVKAEDVKCIVEAN